MSEIALLEPSFADAIAAIEKAEALPRSKRTHWACSLRNVAKALDRPLESIAARWGAVALQINQLHHANSGVAGRRSPTTRPMPRLRCSGFVRRKGLPAARRAAPSGMEETPASPERPFPRRKAFWSNPLLQPERHQTG